VELDTWVVWPLESVHLVVVPKQTVGYRLVLVIGRAQHQDRPIAEEHELSIRAQDASSFRDPLVGIRPDRRAVLGDHYVEALVGEGHVLGRGHDERETEAEFLLERDRGGKLLCGGVEADGAPAPTRYPGRDVRGPAAGLETVLVGDVGKQADLGLGDAPHPPCGLLRGPILSPGLDVVGGLYGPRLTVSGDRISCHGGEG
jgi:hypothetical protein